GSSVSPIEDMIRVNTELSLFDSALAQKPQLVVVNKIDLPQVRARLAEMKDAFNSAGTAALFISAATGEGISELMTEAIKVLQSATAGVETGEKIPRKVFHPKPRSIGASVHREGDTFVVVAPGLERIVTRTGVASTAVHWQLRKQFARLGVSKALEKAGVKPGDKIRCGNLEWEW
ncbi:unnamed protein product, partial [marine sediment metagenome]